MRKHILAAAALLALTTFPAQAAIVGTLGADPNTGLNHTPGLGPFDDQWTFSVSQNSTITIVAILNTYPLGPNTSAFISGFTGSVFEVGNPNPVIGPTAASSPCGPVANCQSLGGQAVLGAGDYFLDFSGIAGSTAAYGGTINTVQTAVPELSTWAMMGIGFAFVGLFGLKRRNQFRVA